MAEAKTTTTKPTTKSTTKTQEPPVQKAVYKVNTINEIIQVLDTINISGIDNCEKFTAIVRTLNAPIQIIE